VYANNGGRFSATNLSLLDYLRFAYKLTDSQTQLMQENAPKWIASEKFDIEARSDNHDPTKDQMRLMMQSLLADRFNLKVHIETRQLPVLAMVLAKPGKLGSQLRRHPPNGPPCSNLRQPSRGIGAQSVPARAGTVEGGYPAICGGLVDAGEADVPSHIRIGARDIPLRLLASNLGGFDRPLLDRTGLEGNFDFFFEWGADPAIGDNSIPGPGAPGTTLEEALRDQLGLKLVRENGPVDVLVVDRVDHLSSQDDIDPSPASTTGQAGPAVAAQPNAPTFAAPTVVRVAQTQQLGTPRPLAFEVVSIRENKSGGPQRLETTPDGWRMTNGSLVNVIQTAYVPRSGTLLFRDSEIVGLPDWTRDRYDITAKVPESELADWQNPQKQPAMLHAMLQAALAERCGLRVHRDSKEVSILALVVGKNGPKFKLSGPDAPRPATNMIPGGGYFIPEDGGKTMHLVDANMRLFASFLVKAGPRGMHIEDRTGLTGRYDFVIHIPEPPISAAGEAVPQPDPQDVAEVMAEQFGLKLEPAKGEVETLVIDHLDRPTEN
jgi:uncharacterized protein (TIGR03435 family)